MNSLEQQLHDHIAAAIRWGMSPERPAYQRALAELREKTDLYDLDAFIAFRGELEAEVLAQVPEWSKLVIERAPEEDVQSALQESTRIVWMQLVAINRGIYLKEIPGFYLLSPVHRSFTSKVPGAGPYRPSTDQDGWGHRIPWKERMAMQSEQPE